jgi:hypothetical protein
MKGRVEDWNALAVEGDEDKIHDIENMQKLLESGTKKFFEKLGMILLQE